MATNTVTLLQVDGPTPTQAAIAASQPPIVYFFQLASRSAVVTANVSLRVLGSLWTILSAALTPVGALFAALSSPILYLLSPAFLLVNILTTILVYQPYNFLVGLMHALYPLYAFVFIAVVVAVSIGFSARLGAYITKMVIFHDKKSQTVRPAKDSSARDGDKAKKVQIKEEEAPPRPIIRH